MGQGDCGFGETGGLCGPQLQVALVPAEAEGPQEDLRPSWALETPAVHDICPRPGWALI